MHQASFSVLFLLCLCPKSYSYSPVNRFQVSGKTSSTVQTRKPFHSRGRGGLTATEKEILAEIRDKLEDSDYQSAFQILKRNPLTQLGKEDARSLLNNLDSLTAVSADFEKNQQQTVDACTFLYKRLERQSVLKGFGCVDGEYPEKSSDITPTKLEQITGISIAALTPMQRTTYWRLAGIGFCLAEYAFGKSVGIDPLLTLIPATLAIFSIDQLFYRGSGFETVYQKIFPEYKKKIIYHEAGHFLLAYLLGIPVRGCVTNAWEARKYPDIKGQAGTIFYDPKLADELLNQKITRSSLDRMSVVIMAGIAAEAIRFGKAEGGAADEQSLVGFLTSIQPPWNILRIQGQARWAAMQAILLIREHEKAYDALCIALEEGKSVGDAILAIEENLPTVLPSLQRIDDRKNRKKTMESDLLMRYIQKVTWKVGGIEAAEYEGNVILGENPHEKASGVLGGGGKVSETAAVDDYIETLAECLGDITERMDVLKSNSNDGQALPPLDTLQTQIKKKQDLRKDINKQSAIVGAVSVNKKSQGGSKNDINDTVDNDDSEMEQDEAVKAFKQKIKRLEKAAKAGQLNVGEKSDDGGVWLNNLESLDLKQPSPPEVEVEKSKVVFPGLGFTNNGEITIPPPLEGYEERIEEMIKRDLKAQEDLLVTPNEDNVLKQIISVVDLSKIDSAEGPLSTSSVTSSSGIWLSQSKGRDALSENSSSSSSSSSEFKESQTLPREMLLTRRGYQVKKLENSKAGFTKKVSDVDARIAELKEALTKREVASSSTVRR